MRITIDEDKCIGTGLCVMGAEDVFDQREEDGIVVLLDANPPASRDDAIREASLACPVFAIAIHEDA